VILQQYAVRVRHVGVGVDGRDTGWAALAWACEEAETDPTVRLTICHAERHGYPVNLARLAATDPTVARHIRACRDRLGWRRVEVDLSTEDPADALLALANRADLLIVGAHAVDDPLHRSTGARVAAHARAPVVVVRPVRHHYHAPFAGHVVVGVDGSPTSRAAVLFGFEHAQRLRLPLAAIHVTNAEPGDFWFDDMMLETHFATEPEPLALLAAEVEPIAVDFPTVRVKRAVCHGTPTDGLRRAATGAYLLVVGRHGHRLPAPLRLGSVSQALIRQATCAVAVVP
jgi:nucleotide-binding universal stress UspA family protein